MNGNQETIVKRTPDSGQPRPIVETGQSTVGERELITCHHPE